MLLCASLVGMLLLATTRHGFSLQGNNFSHVHQPDSVCLLTNLSTSMNCLLSDAEFAVNVRCCECGVLVLASGSRYVCSATDDIYLESLPPDLPAASNITFM